jgi:hypothetical protein
MYFSDVDQPLIIALLIRNLPKLEIMAQGYNQRRNN